MGEFKECILFLSNEQELTRERKGYFDAFSAFANVILIGSIVFRMLMFTLNIFKWFGYPQTPKNR
jgi:hypothetical protein